MSEYQYYEFQTVDRRLSEKEMQELRAYSTRARITPTSFVNEYSFGNFKGDEDAWMEKYFDGFLYLANWGTHVLQLAVPDNLVGADIARLYCPGQAAAVREKASRLIFTFVSDEEEGGEWVEGGGILASLLPLREELARGDLRSLYLGWLLNAQTGELHDDTPEPAVPPNLSKLSGPLSNLAVFLRIDPDLLAVAAQASPCTKPDRAGRETMAAWVASLSARDKDAMLVRVMEGEGPHIGMDLCSQFSRHRAARNPVAEPARRTVAELLTAAKTWGEKRRGDEARKAAEEKARRQHLEAIAREKHLDSLAGRIPEVWAKIEELVASRQPKSYDLAAQHVVDLRDLAARQGGEADFRQRLAALREAHVRKQTFIARLRDKGL
jgi:hypothetical protein